MSKAVEVGSILTDVMTKTQWLLLINEDTHNSFMCINSGTQDHFTVGYISEQDTAFKESSLGSQYIVTKALPEQIKTYILLYGKV